MAIADPGQQQSKLLVGPWKRWAPKPLLFAIVQLRGCLGQELPCFGVASSPRVVRLPVALRLPDFL